MAVIRRVGRCKDDNAICDGKIRLFFCLDVLVPEFEGPAPLLLPIVVQVDQQIKSTVESELPAGIEIGMDGTGMAPPRPRWVLPRWVVWPGAEWFALRCRLGVNCISQPEAVIRSSVLREIGGYNARLPHTSDIEMWLRLSAAADVGRINGVDQGSVCIQTACNGL
jgi:hypothetical protein